MRTSQSSSLLLAAALAAGVSSAHALVTLGTDSELFLTLNTSAQYNDNLFLSSPKVDEFIFDLTPGFRVDYGRNSLVKGQFSYGEDFQIFGDRSHLNTSLSRVTGDAAYDDGKNKLALAGSFQQADQATRDIRRNDESLVHRDIVSLRAVDELLFTAKTSVSVGASYDRTDYKKPGYVDLSAYTIPVKYYYKVLPKLDLSGGYRYRNSNLGRGGIDSDAHFFSVGARGELTPKLTGEIAIGYDEFKPTTGKNRSSVGLEASLAYAYSPKTSFTFGANNGFGYTALGESNRAGGLNAGVSAQLTSDWRFDASALYTGFSYVNSDRSDDYYMGQAAATYTVNEIVSVSGAYAYAKNKSNLSGANFTDNILSVFATIKY